MKLVGSRHTLVFDLQIVQDLYVLIYLKEVYFDVLLSHYIELVDILGVQCLSTYLVNPSRRNTLQSHNAA